MKLKNLFAIMIVCTVLLTVCACGNDEEPPEPPLTTTVPPTTNVGISQDQPLQTAFLGNNLYITDIGNYTGIYMEDGSDELVTEVLMIVLQNQSDNALQLARISLEYADFTAQFEVTNLPAGESVVLLEKNRHAYVSEDYLNATAENVLFFQEPMSLCEDQVEITGEKGSLQVKNLTDQVLGEVYIYYKNSSADLFYGGITYRARVEAGLKPGATYTVMTNHYYPNACSIIDVQILPMD